MKTQIKKETQETQEVRETQMSFVLMDMQEGIAALQKNMVSLEERLTPLLNTDSLPEPLKEDGMSNKSLVPLAERINGYNIAISNLEEDVRKILMALEL